LGALLRRQGGGVLSVLFDWDTMGLKALISDHLVHAVRWRNISRSKMPRRWR
jgi:hypothetical protein